MGLDALLRAGKGQMPIGKPLFQHGDTAESLSLSWMNRGRAIRRRHQEQKQNFVCLLGGLKQVVTALRLSSTVEIKQC